MSKEDIVKFYVELATLVGAGDIRITGHSARVAGAKRMALAGMQVWTIQMFGRWGSSAILGYVREALLGHNGGTLAMQTERAAVERASVKDIRQQARRAIDKASSGGQITQKAKAAMVDMLLEHLADFQPSSSTDAAEETEAMITLKANEIWAYTEMELRVGRARVLLNKRGRLHIQFNKEVCLCGWTWASQRVEFTRRSLPSSGDAKGWCPR